MNLIKKLFLVLIYINYTTLINTAAQAQSDADFRAQSNAVYRKLSILQQAAIKLNKTGTIDNIRKLLLHIQQVKTTKKLQRNLDPINGRINPLQTFVQYGCEKIIQALAKRGISFDIDCKKHDQVRTVVHDVSFSIANFQTKCSLGEKIVACLKIILQSKTIPKEKLEKPIQHNNGKFYSLYQAYSEYPTIIQSLLEQQVTLTPDSDRIPINEFIKRRMYLTQNPRTLNGLGVSLTIIEKKISSSLTPKQTTPQPSYAYHQYSHPHLCTYPGTNSYYPPTPDQIKNYGWSTQYLYPYYSNQHR